MQRSRARQSHQGALRAVMDAAGSALVGWGVVLVVGAIVGTSILATEGGLRRYAVSLEVNGRTFRHRTLQRSPEGVLQELGLSLQAHDSAAVPDWEDLLAGERLRLTLARLVALTHDGRVIRFHTTAATLAEAIAEGGVSLGGHDRLCLEGASCDPQALLPLPAIPSQASLASWVAALQRPIRLTLRRAVSLTVWDGVNERTLYATGRTVGEALLASGIPVYAGDQVQPGLTASIVAGLEVSIQRSSPVVLDVGGIPRALRTHARTVRELLSIEGVTLEDKDYVLPALDAPVNAGDRVAVVRVYEEYYVLELPINYETRYEPDPAANIDEQRVAVWGQEGARRRRVKVQYENQRETARSEEDEWVARQPQDRIIRYGTRITLQSMDTPTGPLTYWRKLRMLATSYNARTAGKSLSHPAYGITRSGQRARKGLIAVDPRVIPLGTEVYVPGYGLALAADTGSAIQWRRIDLCYDDDNLTLWNRWVDVYLLAPVPPQGQIRWIIPNSPREAD